MKSPIYGAAVAAALLLGCASSGSSPPAKSAPVSTTEVTGASIPAGPVVGPEVRELVREDTQVLAPRLEPDYTVRAEVDATSVFDAMHADLQACYAARVRESPRAHAFITMDVVIAPDGHVQSIDTTGGALLGERTMRCMTDRVARATFAPPHGGGTLHLRVPFAMRRVAPGAEP